MLVVLEKKGRLFRRLEAQPDISDSSLPVGCSPAFWAAFFQVSSSRYNRSHSCFSLSLEALSSAMACSVRSFSRVHFSMFCCSFSLSWVMNWTARWRIDPLFFSHPGTILASSFMPSLMVSRRRRSTTDSRSG